MLNNFNENQIVDTDNTTKKQFTQFDPTSNIFLVSTSGGTTPEATGQWDFNEGSGTSVADQKGIQNLTLAGAYTWGSGYTAFTNATFGNWKLPVGYLTQPNSFSVVTWVSMNAAPLSAARWFYTIGNPGQTNNANQALALYVNTANGFVAHIVNPSNAVTGCVIPLSTINPSANQKFLVAVTYQRVGGASNNIMKLRISVDGITWYENVITNAGLMKQLNTYQWRSGNELGANTIGARYYRHMFYNNKVLNNSEIQEIFDVGSEGDFVVATAGLVPTSDKPATVFINNLLYKKTSNVSANVPGENGLKDIFAVPGTGTEFNLIVVNRAGSAPSNSKYLGTGTLSGVNFTINDSLSSLVQKEIVNITTTTSTISLTTLSIKQYDNIFVYINGMLQERTSYITSINQVDFSPTQLNNGDQVIVVKIKNNATITRPS